VRVEFSVTIHAESTPAVMVQCQFAAIQTAGPRVFLAAQLLISCGSDLPIIDLTNVSHGARFFDFAVFVGSDILGLVRGAAIGRTANSHRVPVGETFGPEVSRGFDAVSDKDGQPSCSNRWMPAAWCS
jgi:hypothetical protein